MDGQVLVGERQVDVLGDGKIVEQVITLEDHADALAGKVGALLAVELVHRRLAEPVLAQPAVVEQREHVQQRRLPCSRWSHDGDEFAFVDGEPDAAQHPGFGVAGLVTAFYVFQFDHFNYSDLKASDAPGLFDSQRLHGFDSGGATGWKVAGHQRRSKQKQPTAQNADTSMVPTP